MKFQRNMCRSTRAFILLLATTLPTVAVTQTQNHVNGNFTSLSDAFWQLANLTLQPESSLHRRPQLGGQNYTHCCLLAVNASLDLIDGFIIKKQPDFIKVNVSDLLAANDAGQFPCTATWNGDRNGAPIVETPASWLESTCPGWQLSDTSKGDESQWISPFVGFLLPAVVFCLTLPRRRKLAVWRKLFVQDLSQVVSWLLAPASMLLAGLIVVCDTIIWLCTCFAFASPMILSGLYEAWLDYKVMGFLTEKTNNFRLTLDMRARLLFVILVGNLDLEPEVRSGDTELVVLNNKDEDDNERWPNYALTTRNPSSPWTHIENLVHPLRSYRDSALGTPRQWPIHDVKCSLPNCTDLYCKEVPLRRDEHTRREIGRTKTRLRTMLACQYSFGTTVGAPVVFFLGAFGFTMVTTIAEMGDEDTSLALAFGMWYMIIPHISIISGLLLAGNNPNTLEGVVALEFGDVEEGEERFEARSFGHKVFELAYDSRYKPKWLWLRGRSKRDWVEKVWKTYKLRPPPGHRGAEIPDEDMVALREATSMTLMSWGIVLGMTFLLMGVPFILAFLTAFFTPQVGVSCRSLTFLVYAIAQLCQIVLWMWAYAGAPTKNKFLSFFTKEGYLDRKGFFTPTDASSLWSNETFWSFKSLWSLIWYNLAVFFGLGGVISALGGTMMQLMGVYTSNQCSLNAGWWTRPHGDVMVIVSKNYALEIEDAMKYWIPCAITAILFLGVVSFCGWWYQRRLRGLFRNLVSGLGDPGMDREDIRAVVTPDSGIIGKA